MTELIVDNLGLALNGTTLVEPSSFRLAPGEFIVLLGPNGAGKTSLIRAALGLETPTSGSAIINGHRTDRLRPTERARNVAYLPQIRPLAWPNTVRDIVALGRYSHGATLGRLSPDDAAAVDGAISACDLSDLSHRSADTLSGGELARMHCARAFAAEAPLLIADEPTSALDPRHQFRILDLFANFVRQGGGALVVLHDIQMAARYATRLLWMKDAQIIADGSPDATLNAERMRDVYGVRATIEGLNIDLLGPL